MPTFDPAELVAECDRAVHGAQPLLEVRDVLERALADASSVRAALAQDRGGLFPLHVADDLTVLNVVWAPGMTLFPHDHRMWAAIGIYGGSEDNTFFRRVDGDLERSGGSTLDVGDVLLLGDDAIHGVHNPFGGLTGAIHVYGGQFFTTPRSEWDPDTHEERAFDVEHARAAFAEANLQAGFPA